MTGRPNAAVALDGDLVKRAAAGDMAAFEALVEPRLNRTFRTASAILGNEADAADAVQEAFVAAWRHLPAIRDGAKFDAWLNKVILNRVPRPAPSAQSVARDRHRRCG